MNDKELLELAAKAAGYEYEVDNGRIFLLHHRNAARYEWCPLYDDGDALRLAVKLGLLVDCDYHLKESEAMGRGARQVVGHEDNPFAATRRAIVRAAAEIGRRM